MGHMRIPTEIIAARAPSAAAGVNPSRTEWTPKRPRTEYLFTQSKWGAIAFAGGASGVTLEDGPVDPKGVFPWKVMKDVEYGQKLGIEIEVMQFVSGAGRQPVGAVMYLSVGGGAVGLGYYAVHYGHR